MLEVLERPRLEVVDADDAVVARQQVLAEMRSGVAGTAGDETGWHLLADCNSGFHVAGGTGGDTDGFLFTCRRILPNSCYLREISQFFSDCEISQTRTQSTRGGPGHRVLSLRHILFPQDAATRPMALMSAATQDLPRRAASETRAQ